MKSAINFSRGKVSRAHSKKGFEGWYYKHQEDGKTIAFIPGKAESGAFIQMIDQEGSRHFEVPELRVEHGVIYAGNCRFSCKGAVIDLPGVSGKITYGSLLPLRSDIMGPFRFLPMECRHGVISMSHTISGSLTVDGEKRCFDKGLGYIEKDSGTSFPRSYLWLQCNDFPGESCSVMISVAHIPFVGASFTGCICAVIFEGHEYRLATYRGVRIHLASPEHICLSQGSLLLEIDIAPADRGHPLRSPSCGMMSGIIHESSNVAISIRLWDKGTQIFDLSSHHAAFEYVD